MHPTSTHSFFRASAALLLASVGVVTASARSAPVPLGVFALQEADPSRAIASVSAAFVANKGQWDGEALFLSSTRGVDTWVTATGVVYDFHRYIQEPPSEQPPNLQREFLLGPRPLGVSPEEWDPMGPTDPRHDRDARLARTSRVGHVVRMAFLGTAPAQYPVGQGLLPGSFNYMVGADRSRWAAGVPRYAKAVVRNLYHGIDAVYYVDRGSPRYDLLVRPGADPTRIRFVLDGATSVRTTSDGRVAFGTRFGEFEMNDLRAFQGNRPVSCALSVSPNGTVRFILGRYDRSQPLTIDPLVSSTYLGGTVYDQASAVEVDGAGNAVVVGETSSVQFPTTTGPYLDRVLDGISDGFVARFNSAGWLLTSTFLGGGNMDRIHAVAVDPSGNAVVSGETSSSDFPTSSAPNVDRTLGGSMDGFVARLNPAGWLLSSTFVGGSDDEWADGIAVDASGNTVLAGTTESADFVTSEGLYIDRTLDGESDAFLVRIDPLGQLVASTFLGGVGNEWSYALALDGSANAVVCGYTTSADFPVPVAPYLDRNLDGPSDGFVAKLNPAGWLLTSTYLGGSGGDHAYAIALDSSGNAYVCGQTDSSNFPIAAGAYIDRTLNGANDAFVARLNASCWLLSSSYLGGAGTEAAYGISVDGSGNAVVCGETFSIDVPTTAGEFDRILDGPSDAFVARLNPLCWLLTSTFFGGSSGDSAASVAVDASGNAAFCGYTTSSNFPTSDGLYIDRAFDGGSDAFVARLSAP